MKFKRSAAVCNGRSKIRKDQIPATAKVVDPPRQGIAGRRMTYAGFARFAWRLPQNINTEWAVNECMDIGALIHDYR